MGSSIHLSWARVRLRLHVVITNARRDEEIADALEMAGLFFFMAEESFYLDAALTVQKLCGWNEYGGLRKFLNKSQQDYDRMPYSAEGLSKSDIRRHLATLAEFKDQLDRLKTLRDKWLAHHDRIAFDDPFTFVHEYYVQPRELNEMINAAQSILRQHYLAFGSDFSPGLSRETDVLALIDLLVRYRKAFEHRFDIHSDDEEIVDLLFNSSQSRIEQLRSDLLDSLD